MSDRGIALIINNYKFKIGRDFPGEGEDGKALAFEFKNLGYEVVHHNNITASEMKELIKSVRLKVKPNNDSLIVVIASHGNEIDGAQIVYGKDQEYLNLTTEVIDVFNNDNCSDLKNAVKLFIIDCCRGNQEFPGINASRLCSRDRNRSVAPPVSLSFNTRQSPNLSALLVYSKLIVVNATQKGFVSTNISEGSILLWAFVKCIKKDSKQNLKDLIDKVAKGVEKYAEIHNFRQKIQIEEIADIENFSLDEPGQIMADNYLQDVPSSAQIYGDNKRTNINSKDFQSLLDALSLVVPIRPLSLAKPQ